MELDDVAVFDGQEPLSKALNEILTTGTIAVVTQKGKYYGIIDDREMRGGIANSSRAKCINMSVRAPYIEDGMGTYEAMRRFLAGHFKALPVLKKGKVLGTVSRASLMKQLLMEKAVPKVSVEMLMNTPLFTVDANETVGMAKSIMKSTGVHRLAVTERNRVMGVVSTLDLSMSLLKPKGRDFMIIRGVEKEGERPIREFMRERFVTVKRGDTLPEAAEKMARHNVSTLTVMEGDKGVGVVTARDVMKFMMGLHAERPEVFVSGLSEDDVQYYDSIRDSLKGAVKKFMDTFEVRSISVRVKKGKSTYVVNTYVDVEHSPMPFRVEAYDLKSAIDGTAAEIKRLLTKKKAYMKMKKRPFYAEEA